jgi:hypothetical protein
MSEQDTAEKECFVLVKHQDEESMPEAPVSPANSSLHGAEQGAVVNIFAPENSGNDVVSSRQSEEQSSLTDSIPNHSTKTTLNGNANTSNPTSISSSPIELLRKLEIINEIK